MKISEFQELSRRTMPVVNDDSAKSNYAMGLAGETGEVVDLIKKWVHHKHPENKEELVKELGDVIHYAVGVATLYDISMDEVLAKNILKLSKRYPNGFSVQDSQIRRDLNE